MGLLATCEAILNKDTEDGLFAKAFVQDPAGVQAGPLIEQLIAEAIGHDFIGSSFLGIVANKNAQVGTRMSGAGFDLPICDPLAAVF